MICEIDEKEVNIAGASNTRMQVLTEGAGNFTMRRFVVEKGGHTPMHSHPWEHEAYVLKGRGRVAGDKSSFDVEEGTVIYVEPEEKHQFLNTGDEPFEFICVIPAGKACLIK